jgi:hypothetical protein
MALPRVSLGFFLLVEGDYVNAQLLGDLCHPQAVKRTDPPEDISLDSIVV